MEQQQKTLGTVAGHEKGQQTQTLCDTERYLAMPVWLCNKGLSFEWSGELSPVVTQ